MRKILSLVLSLSFCLSASADENAEPALRLRGGADLYHSSLMSSAGTLRMRPKLGGEYFLMHGLVFLGEFTTYKIPLGAADLGRTEISAGLGYRLLENRLTLGLLYSQTNTSYPGYDSESAAGYGARASYNQPLTQDSRFSLVGVVGFDYQKKVTLHHDTGVPVTNSSISNALCALFTLGLVNSCGTRMTYLSLPAARQYFASVQLAYTF